jgi:ferredoxin
MPGSSSAGFTRLFEIGGLLAIDPDECIDCDACKLECPVEAIFPEDEVPEAWEAFVALNREMAATCPPITDRKEPLPRRPSGS